MNWIRNKYAGVLTLVLLAQGTLFYAASRGERVPAGAPLDLFPAQLGNWRETQSYPVEQEIRDQLKADDLLNRLYTDPQSRTVADLFVAYFKTQRTGQSPHSPKNCLPGIGIGTGGYRLSGRRGGGSASADPDQPLRRFARRREERGALLVSSPRRVIASEFSAKFWLVMDSIRYHRSDTALVRVTVPFAKNDQDAATRIGVEFVRTVFPVLKSYLPS